MKNKALQLIMLFSFAMLQGLTAQVDTISNNTYQFNGKLGIGTTEPWNPLTIDYTDPEIGFATNTGLATFRRVYDASSVRFQIYGYPDTELMKPHVRKSIMLYSTEEARDMIICSGHQEGRLRFFTGGWGYDYNEKMVIETDGKVGIGTTEPLTQLHVAQGDIYLSEITSGIIMKSPDGNCWRGTIGNAGILQFESIDCPATNPETPTQIQSLSQQSIHVYPNPSSGLINIDLSNLNEKRCSYTIYDLQGREMQSGKLHSEMGQINVDEIQTGSYILAVESRKGQRLASHQILVE